MLIPVAIAALVVALACVAHAFLVFSSARAESATILKQHRRDGEARPQASDPPAHPREIPRMFASRTGRGSLIIALVAVLLAAAAAAVHEKVASAHPKTDHAATPSAAALTGLLADLPSFTGQNSFHSGPIDRNLCLVQYFEGAKQVGRRRS